MTDYIDSIIIFTASFIFLYLHRRKQREYLKIFIKEDPKVIFDIISTKISLKYDIDDLYRILEINNNSAQLSLRDLQGVLALIMLIKRYNSISFALKIIWLLKRLHLLIVIGLLFSFSNFILFIDPIGIFISLLIAIVLLPGSFKARKQHSQKVLDLINSLSIDANLDDRKRQQFVNGVFFCYPYTAMMIPGRAIQWILDLFRPDEKD